MSKLIIESDTEKLFGLPSGFEDEETITEGQAEAIKGIISRLGKVKTKGDIDGIIKALRALVI